MEQSFTYLYHPRTLGTGILFFINLVIYLECMLREEPLGAVNEAHGAV